MKPLTAGFVANWLWSTNMWGGGALVRGDVGTYDASVMGSVGEIRRELLYQPIILMVFRCIKGGAQV